MSNIYLKYSDDKFMFQSNLKSEMRFKEYYRNGFGTENVGPFLASLIRMIRPQKVLEIGIGYTTPFMLEALEQNDVVHYDNLKHNLDYYKEPYKPVFVSLDDMSRGDTKIPEGKYINFLKTTFQGKAKELKSKYGNFDFVWFDCGGSLEYEQFMKEYWSICSEYVLFHYTYTRGKQNKNMKTILENIESNVMKMDIIEPNKFTQGSVTMLKKIRDE